MPATKRDGRKEVVESEIILVIEEGRRQKQRQRLSHLFGGQNLYGDVVAHFRDVVALWFGDVVAHWQRTRLLGHRSQVQIQRLPQ